MHPTVALFKVEDEYMALCATTQEVMCVRHLLTDLKKKLQRPIQMMGDNKDCISFATISTQANLKISMSRCILLEMV